MVTVVQASGLLKRFGGVTAVDSIDLSFPEGALVGLIGPNGSGKTTTLNLLNGAITPDSGRIEVAGKKLDGKSSSAFVNAGVTRTFQNPRVFESLTALENLLVPVLHSKGGTSKWTEKAEGLLEEHPGQ